MQTITETLTARRNRIYEADGMIPPETPCSLWWVVLVISGDETRPVMAYWCPTEEQADEQAARFRADGYLCHVCATPAA